MIGVFGGGGMLLCVAVASHSSAPVILHCSVTVNPYPIQAKGKREGAEGEGGLRGRAKMEGAAAQHCGG